jgi:hypothetical protein
MRSDPPLSLDLSHSSSKADVLGDRVAIMSLGELQCIGSTHFLKSTYGAGYNLIFDKLSNATASQVYDLTQFIQSHIPSATYNPPHNTDAEIQLQYTLPFDSVSKFGPFFLALDENLDTLCVSKYGVTITSLEDVFLKVCHPPFPTSLSVTLSSGGRGSFCQTKRQSTNWNWIQSKLSSELSANVSSIMLGMIL